MTLQPRANIVSAECDVEHAKDNVMDLLCIKMILLEVVINFVAERYQRLESINLFTEADQQFLILYVWVKLKLVDLCVIIMKDL